MNIIFILALVILTIIIILILLKIFGISPISFCYYKFKGKKHTLHNRRNNLRYLFNTFIDEINNTDIEYWIDHGTLLGYFRDKDIICGDDDIDICILYKDNNKLKKLLNTIKRKYPNLLVDSLCILPNTNCHYSITDKKTGLTIDIYVFDLYKNNKILYKSTPLIRKIALQEEANYNKEDILPLKKVSFLNKKIYIPNKIETVLTKLYGKKYMTPLLKCDKECNCSK